MLSVRASSARLTGRVYHWPVLFVAGLCVIAFAAVKNTPEHLRLSFAAARNSPEYLTLGVWLCVLSSIEMLRDGAGRLFRIHPILHVSIDVVQLFFAISGVRACAFMLVPVQGFGGAISLIALSGLGTLVIGIRMIAVRARRRAASVERTP